jgi:cystathionine gamma-synthase
MPEDPALSSLLAQGYHFVDEETGAIVPPIHLSATFHHNVDEFGYRRESSPTTAVAERMLSELNGGRSLAFASGISAAVAILETVRTGQHIIAHHTVYQGIKRWMMRLRDMRGIDVTFLDVRDEDAFQSAVRPGKTVLVWTEAVVNPTCEVVDVKALADRAHAAGARLAVDATFTPPVTIRPVELGADFVMQSATKYLNGHSDVVAGIVTAREDGPMFEEMGAVRKLTGSILHPLDAWLLMRGMRTLPLRFERASSNALAIARHFEHHPKLDGVSYPGLEDHPDYAVAARQLTGGFGGMMALYVKGGRQEALQVADTVRLIIQATSLGGVESLIEYRAAFEADVNPVPENLLRLSVGIEDAGDLIRDLERALQEI